MKTKLLSHSIKFALFSVLMAAFFSLEAQPIITLNGNSTIYVEINSNYVSPGATAYDSIDGNLTNAITLESDLNINSIGVYTETYSVINTRGKSASVSRMVVVRNDLTPPVIQLIGDDTIFIEARRDNPNFVDPGAIATDNWTPYVLTSSILVDGQVNTRRVGIYLLNYQVEDVSGNKSLVKTRTVIVGDTRAPEWINGGSPHYLPLGVIFIDSVDIVDAYDSDISFNVSFPVTGPVNVNVAGQYDYIYVAQPDSSGNLADTLYKTYIVQNKVTVNSLLNSTMKVFPSPFSGQFNIQLSGYMDEMPLVEMFDINGRKVNINIASQDARQITIQANELEAGIYFIHVSCNGLKLVERVIKD